MKKEKLPLPLKLSYGGGELCYVVIPDESSYFRVFAPPLCKIWQVYLPILQS
jgi:hypothetical protein